MVRSLIFMVINDDSEFILVDIKIPQQNDQIEDAVSRTVSMRKNVLQMCEKDQVMLTIRYIAKSD